ncbi:MAG TPA: DUF72 domain-containing protein [Opitutaceae bacterium]|nr:DUF72 domain-containing protein [Opitutaceae bacterium]
MPTVRIGISGWRYPPWRGVFYPQGLPQRSELNYASRLFPSVEINGSFYSLQTPSSYGAWAEATPDRFQFSVKGPRFITHLKRLRDIEIPLANFFASGVLRLGSKLGPLLWQFPPSFRYDPEKMDAFFRLLPQSADDALRLAKRCDGHLKTAPWLKIERSRSLRHAVEIRHPSFETKEFVVQLRKHRVGLVVADTAGRWPFMEDVTADFVYVRLHGDVELYASGYSDRALDRWAQKIADWKAGRSPEGSKLSAERMGHRKAGRDVYVYFDNDVKVQAPYDAMKLAHRLGLGPPPVHVPLPEEISEVPRTRWPMYAQRNGKSPKRVAK